MRKYLLLLFLALAVLVVLYASGIAPVASLACPGYTLNACSYGCSTAWVMRIDGKRTEMWYLPATGASADEMASGAVDYYQDAPYHINAQNVATHTMSAVSVQGCQEKPV